MSDKLMALLMPRLSPTMTEEEKTRFLAVLDHMFKVEQKENEPPKLFWANTLSGRYRRAGEEVQGATIKVVSRNFPRNQIIWMCITRQIVFARAILQTTPLWPGDPLLYWDLRTWRHYPDGDLIRKAPVSTLRRTRYTDWQGVQRTPT